MKEFININKEIIKNERDKEYYLKLADKLEEMNKTANQGRGANIIKSVILFLKNNNIESAKADCFQQRDKFTWISDIKKVIIDELFEEGEENPWSPIDINKYDND